MFFQRLPIFCCLFQLSPFFEHRFAFIALVFVTVQVPSIAKSGGIYRCTITTETRLVSMGNTNCAHTYAPLLMLCVHQTLLLSFSETVGCTSSLCMSCH